MEHSKHPHPLTGEARDDGNGALGLDLADIPDDELPGMWERADFEGGREEVRGSDWKPANGVKTVDGPQTMTLSFEPGNRAFWHTDCANHFGGVVTQVAREETRSLMECQHCRQRGYYQNGWVGQHRVPVQPDGASVPTGAAA